MLVGGLCPCNKSIIKVNALVSALKYVPLSLPDFLIKYICNEVISENSDKFTQENMVIIKNPDKFKQDMY